ncbi:MAG: response regulator transcription factor [Anaerolineales bacterium]|nr:response regulator transcription factor [Anaerolineales bacterium]
MIRILVVDDQIVICEGLRVVLNEAASIEVVAAASNGAEALELFPQVRPDLVLMDPKMPVMNGIAATRQLKELSPKTPVLVLTTYDDDEWVFDAIRAGADGYLLKDSYRDLLVAAIEGTIAGRTHIDASVTGRLFSFVRTGRAPDTEAADALTERERQILRLVARGDSNAVIAEKLFLALGTVQNYVSRILAKLYLADRTQAAAFAWQYGLVYEDTPGAENP